MNRLSAWLCVAAMHLPFDQISFGLEQCVVDEAERSSSGDLLDLIRNKS